jgi:glycosyltransferase involved in cell wall biosynthesis
MANLARGNSAKDLSEYAEPSATADGELSAPLPAADQPGLDQPLVSVIIPCYKQAQFLSDAIESVLAQTYPHHEVIVVDDGSPDDTAAVAARYPMVTYVHQQNRGLPTARNTGVHRSIGRFLLFLDADDRLTSDHFTRSLAAFEERPEAAVVSGDWRWFGLESAPHVHNCDRLPDYYGSLLRRSFLIPIHTVMLRRSVFLSLGGFREGLRVWEDVDFFLRLAKRYTIYCHHAVIAEYRRHSEQTIRRPDVMLKGVMAVYRAERRYVRKHSEYADAYRVGLEHIGHIYGDQVFWLMVVAFKERHWRRAFRYAWLLLRYYPRGAAALLVEQMVRSLGTALGVNTKPSP